MQAGKNCGWEEGAPTARPLLNTEPIGELSLAVGQRAPRQDLPLRPPEGGTDELLRWVEQRLERRIVEFLAPAPAHALVKQARIVLQMGRDLGDGALDAGLEGGELEASIGEQPVIGGHPRNHAMRRLGETVPPQAVEPLDVILAANDAVIARQDALLVEAAELAIDPDVADLRRGGGILAGRHHPIGLSQLAVGGDPRGTL